MENSFRKLRQLQLAALITALSLTNVTFAAETTADGELRVSESAHSVTGGRDRSTPDRVSTDVYEPGESAGKRSAAKRSKAQQKSSSADAAQSPNTDFWIYAADVELFSDQDRDGYFHGIDLLFDADTVYTTAEVYAVVYLSRDGGPWLEYSETENFNIYGASGDDEYVIVSELLAGYPTGSYDVLIELFDAWDNAFVADFGPENSSELAFLPLEDSERDTPVAAPTPIVVSHGGGGSFDLAALTILAALCTALQLRRRYRLQLECVTSDRRGPSA